MRTLARLVLFGAFACGSAVSQEASTPAGPPNIEVVSHSWLIVVFKPDPLAPPPNSQTVEPGVRGVDAIAPPPKAIEIPQPRRFYIYSAELLNRGPKDITALSWDYLFGDPLTHAELKRQSGFHDGKIHVNQKKKLEIRTPSSPPMVISADSPNPNNSPFEERISIQCILFADGSFWENPESKGISCEKLRILSAAPREQ